MILFHQLDRWRPRYLPFRFQPVIQVPTMLATSLLEQTESALPQLIRDLLHFI